MCASIITDKLPSFSLASCFPLVKYSVILLLTVSNTVTNAVDLYTGFVGLVLCLRGCGDASSVGRASRVYGMRGAGVARCYIYLYCRGGGWVEI